MLFAWSSSMLKLIYFWAFLVSGFCDLFILFMFCVFILDVCVCDDHDAVLFDIMIILLWHQIVIYNLLRNVFFNESHKCCSQSQAGRGLNINLELDLDCKFGQEGLKIYLACKIPTFWRTHSASQFHTKLTITNIQYSVVGISTMC